MRAGLLRKRMTIQTGARVSDGQGGVTVTWSDVATVWGSLDGLKTDERINALAVQATLTHKIVIRYYPNLTPRHRVKVGTRVFNIIGVRNYQDKNVLLELDVVEVVQ